MKMAMVGCGALGSYYGARLSQAGHDVRFLLRSDYEVVQRQGVRVESVEGDFAVRPACARSPEEIGPVDVVWIGLKTTANAAFPRLLPPLLGRATAVVSLQNGLGDEEEVAAVVGEERVLGGLCFVCLNRVAPGHIRHSAHGLVVLGEHGRRPMPRTEALAACLRAARVPCRVTENLAQSHWEKLVWNIPFNGLGVAGVAGYEAVCAGVVDPARLGGSTLPTALLLGEPRWESLVRELMVEVIEAAHALGYPLDPNLATEQIERTRIMGAYKASTLVDWEEGRALEVQHLFETPLRRAQSAGKAMPRLAAMCAVLRALDAARTRAHRRPA